MLENSTAPAEAIRDRITIVLDHDIPAGSFASAFIQKHLIDYAREYELNFLQSAGIAYELLYQKMQAGDVFVTCGEHSSIMGARGAIGLTLTYQEMQTLLAEGSIRFRVPETCHVALEGRLPEGVSAWDATLSIAAGAGYPREKAVALSCAADALAEDERKVFCLPAYRAGAVTAYFEDSCADPDAVIRLDAMTESAVPPASFPAAVPLAMFGQVPVNACFIGGCAGDRIEDLRLAASILKGHRIRRELRLLIGFVDNETYLQAVHEGLVHIFFDCGAQVTNPGCASCQTTSIGVVGDGEVMATTGCYNYIGCSGTRNSRLYIASVASVARAALTGVLEAPAQCVSGKEA